MTQPKSLLLAAAVLAGMAGAARAGDEPGPTPKKAQEAGYDDEGASAEEVAALFDQALGSCCATGACAESGECDALAECEACAAGECSPEAHVSPAEKLIRLVTLRPDALAALRPRLEEKFLATDTVDTQRGLMVELLAWCEADESLTCGEQLYAARPAAFSEDHVLAFSAKGSEVFAKDLEQLARKGRVMPCAFFALQDEPRGDKLSKQAVKHLERAVRAKTVDAESARDQLVAGRVLAELGDEQVLATVRHRVHRAVLAALDGGRLDAARSMTLQAEFFARAASEYGSPQGLGSMGSQMRWHVAARSKEVATADEVFELIEAITPM